MENIQGSVQNAMDATMAFLATYGLNAVGAIVILIVGWTAAGWAARAVDGSLGRIKSTDVTLRRFVASLTRYLIITFTVLAVLSQFGVQTTSLIAVFGAASLAIGLALQGTLGNLASGVMILIFRPYRIDDRVNAGGHEGIVEEIDLFTTVLRTPDNVQLLVPNGKVWGNTVTNYSVHKTRRVDLKLVVDDSIDLDRLMVTIRSVLAKDPRAQAQPAPSVKVSEIGESTATLSAHVWATSEHHDDVKFNLMKTLKDELKAALKTVST